MSAERPADERAATVRLDPDWELWALENLMAGAPSGEVQAALVDEGVDADVARAAVELLAQRDGVRLSRRRLARGRRSEQVLRLQRALRGRLAVDVVDDEPPDVFYERRWVGGRPVVFDRAFGALRALGWGLERIEQQLGDVEVEVNARRTEAGAPAEIERAIERVRLGDFVAGCRIEAGNDRYIVSRNGLLQRPELRPLVDDLAPLPGILDGSGLPRGASLWIGPAGTFTHPHFDPHHAFLVMLEGRKRVRLCAPDQPALFEGMSGYFARWPLTDPRWRERPGFDEGGVAEVVLEPGQGLFVPVGTWHEVEGLEPSVMISFLCFRWDNDFHWLRP